MRSVLAIPIPGQMPKAFNQCSLRICSESIPKWGSKPFVSFFWNIQISTVIFTFFFLNNIYFFSSAGLPCFICVGTILLLLKLFAFIFSRKRFLRATTFSPRFFLLNKSSATTGIGTQEDCCPLDLQSNGLTTRP